MFTNSVGSFDAVICDLDGCLASESGGPFEIPGLTKVAQHNTDAYQKRDRPVVTLCTGRPLPFAEAMGRLIQNLSLPIVAENGVWLYHPENNRYVIDPAITSEHLEVVHEASQLLRQKYSSAGVTQQPGKSAAVTLFHPEPEYLKGIIDEVRELIESRDWPFRVSMTWHYINCDLQHISKRSGIERLMEATGLSSDRLAGIGDTMSDVTMADCLGYFACPANAEAEIKTRANYVSGFDEVNGVLDILGHLESVPALR